MRRFLPLVLLISLAAPAWAKAPKMLDLTDTVGANRILTKFGLLLRFSEQASFLSSRGPFTVFVPTDSAFSRMPPEVFAALERPENQAVLQRIVLFHIVNGQRLSTVDLGKLKTLLSCEGNPLPLRVNHMGYQVVSRAKIIHADIRCLNGLMHEIDTVLLPPGVTMTTLATLAAAAPAPPPASNTVASPAPPTNDGPVVAPISPSPEPASTDSETNTPPSAGNTVSSPAPSTNNGSLVAPISPSPEPANSGPVTNAPPPSVPAP